MKYIILISLCFISCTPIHKENNSKINNDYEETYIIDSNKVTKLEKEVELISIIDIKLKNVLEKIIKKKDKDCENTFRFIKATGTSLVFSEYFLNFLMKDKDNYILTIDDQLIIVQAAKLNKKMFKKLGVFVKINYSSLREDEIGNFIDFSYWYIKDGKIIKEIINNPCNN